MIFIQFVMIVTMMITLPFSHSDSCTLWGSLGSLNKKDETLIAKNRDWKPDHIQIVKIAKPKSGYDYLGLYAEGNDEPGMKAGINQRGLVIVSASASSLPKKERKESTHKNGLMKKILSTYDRVDDILKHQKMFSQTRPLFYMMADKNKMIYIEVGLNGEYSITEQTHGVLYHTNHYLNNDLSSFNKIVGESSLKRFERIKYLLTHSPVGLSFDEFINMSKDQNDGPHNSIFRTGKSQQDERTLATWIVSIPKNDGPMIYIKLRNPGESEKEFKSKIDDTFWRKNGLQTYPIFQESPER